MRTARWTVLLMLLGTAAYGAEVYRSTAPDGTVSYSDRPQDARSQAVVVATSRPGRPAVVAPSAATTAARAAATAAPAAEPEAPAKTPAELQAERRQNCDVARERQQRYEISHRLYRTLPNGEREYLDDQQIDEARARAVADVQTWCD